MKGMFKNATKFNSPLDIWNVRGVSNVEHMFDNAVEFDQPLNSWDTSYFYLANYMFSNATKFNQPLDKWFGPNGTENYLEQMSFMFSGASAFNQNLCRWYQSSYCVSAYYYDQYYYYCTYGVPIADYVFDFTKCTNTSDPDFDKKTSFCFNC
jgi:hypothetical protein